MSGVASLPMYGSRQANEAFWEGLRLKLEGAGIAAPARLGEPADCEAHWLDPDLVLSQTCGLPLTTRLVDKVEVVGVPHYAALGCEGPNYRSVILVRADDEARTLAQLRGLRAAINDFGSHSGCSQLFAVVAAFAPAAEFFSDVAVSGSHLDSIELVRSGRADVASIDCVTLALAARDRPLALQGLRVIGRSAPSPGLPLVTAKGAPPERLAALRAAIAAAIRDPELAGARSDLLISGFSPLSADAYASFPQAAFDGTALAGAR